MSIAETASTVMSRAQDGDPQGALDLAHRALQEHDGTISLDVVALWYAASVAEHTLGRHVNQIEAADRCLAMANELGSPGWASNALSIRAMAYFRLGDMDAVMADLAVAEVELEACTDDGLASWAHTGLGYCYDQLRLYELAQPHFEAAITGTEDPIELPEGRIIDLLNLAEMHLRWAEELFRVVPVAATLQDVDLQYALGLTWSEKALQAVRHLGLPTYLQSSERLDLCLRADSDPAGVVDDLRAAVEGEVSPATSNRAGGHSQIATALARALRSLGDLDGAVVAARQAVDSSRGPVDWQIKAAAQHLLVEVQAECGVAGAADGRDYGRLLSEVLWAQRLRTLQGARTARDVERLQRAREAAERRAREDPLTGLGNRRALDEVVQQITETTVAGGRAEDHHPYSLLMVDLDEFKDVNDTYGHLIGDRVLQAVAALLLGQARSDDLVVRLGGDEFVVLAPVDGPDAQDLAGRLHQALSAVDWGQIAPDLTLRVSIGVATTGPDLTVSDLVARADDEMYRTKPNSRLG